MSHGYVEPTDVPPEQRCMAPQTWDVVLDLCATGRLRLIWHDLRGSPNAKTRKSPYSVVFTDGEGAEVVPFEALGYNEELGLYDKRRFPDVSYQIVLITRAFNSGRGPATRGARSDSDSDRQDLVSDGD